MARRIEHDCDRCGVAIEDTAQATQLTVNRRAAALGMPKYVRSDTGGMRQDMTDCLLVGPIDLCDACALAMADFMEGSPHGQQ